MSRVAGFTISGPGLPATLAAGQSASFNVTFTPTSGGAASGVLVRQQRCFEWPAGDSACRHRGHHRIVDLGPVQPEFWHRSGGTPKTTSATLTNSGGSSVTLSDANLTGAGFTLNGLSLPATLAAGQTKALSVTFTPQSGGSASGTLSLISDASRLAVPLTATGAAAAASSLSSSPSSLSFGNVQAGTPKTVSATLTNSGTASITISQANVTGTGFTVGGLNLPATLPAGQSTALSVTYTPQSAGSATGSLSIASDASNTSMSVPSHRNRSRCRRIERQRLQSRFLHRSGEQHQHLVRNSDQHRQQHCYREPGQCLRNRLPYYRIEFASDLDRRDKASPSAPCSHPRLAAAPLDPSPWSLTQPIPLSIFRWQELQASPVSWR